MKTNTNNKINKLLLTTGSIVLVLGIFDNSLAITTTATPEFEPELIQCAVANLFKLIEGAFGALIMVVSGIGAIIAAAMGAYRASLGMLVVAVGSFILRSLVSLFFGTDFPECQTQ